MEGSALSCPLSEESCGCGAASNNIGSEGVCSMASNSTRIPCENSRASAISDNRTLNILSELNRIFEERLTDIDEQTNGNFELKYITYKEWVEMLLKLMKDLIDVVNELEYEASSRIELLERKLQIEAGSCSGSDIGKLKNDLSNLIELIHRALDTRQWNLDGLKFYTINVKDIFGSSTDFSDSSTYCHDPRNEAAEEETASSTEDEVFKACITELKECLREKETQLSEKLRQNDCLQTELRLYKSQAAQKDKAIANVRALAFEVADKHDQLLQMRNQVNSLEEELKKAHKKIQFKDNVIRDLRREVKNSSESASRPLSPNSCRCVRGRNGSDTDRQSFKSIHAGEYMHTDRSDCTMNTVIEADNIGKYNDCLPSNEDRCIKILREELDKFLDYQATHNDALEDQKRIIAVQHAKLRDLVNKMLTELARNRNKLTYVRNRLISMSDASDMSQSMSPKCEDSGYISPEDIEPECHLIETLRYRMAELKDENESLKEQIQKLNAEMVSTTSSGLDKAGISDYNEKILQEVASALSDICGKEISIKNSNHSRSQTCEGQIHPICQAVRNLESELDEKKELLRNTKEILARKDCELKTTQKELYKLEEECDNKNHQINELQKAVDYHVDSFERLQNAKQNLEAEFIAVKRMTEETDYKTLLEAKNKLENECQNQITTINNLRQALETMKKSVNSSTNQNPPTVSAPTNVNLSNPFWGWLRNNNVHDI